MRLEQTDDFSSEYVADSGKHAGEDRAEREAERSTSEYTDTALTSGRDFPLLSEDILDRNGAMDNTQGVFSGSLQDQPESLHSDDRQYSAVESLNTTLTRLMSLKKIISSRQIIILPASFGAMSVLVVAQFIQTVQPVASELIRH